jgi:dTDP-4-amino-4,6-dideoxygalactose transaminase
MSADAWKRFGDTGYRHYQVVEAGFKYNMMDMQAAIGIHQLQRVEAAWQRREILWRAYQEALASFPIIRPADPAPGTRHSHHLYAIQVESGEAARDKLLQGMTSHGIGVGVHYLSVAEHPYYQERFGWKPEDWPHAMRIGRTTLSLPLMPQLSAENQGRVVQALSECLRDAA